MEEVSGPEEDLGWEWEVDSDILMEWDQDSGMESVEVMEDEREVLGHLLPLLPTFKMQIIDVDFVNLVSKHTFPHDTQPLNY